MGRHNARSLARAHSQGVSCDIKSIQSFHIYINFCLLATSGLVGRRHRMVSAAA